MQENLLDSIDGFGPIFHGYSNKPEKAIGKLLAEKSGEVPDAYRHPELGEIGFVYGNEHLGLAHIIHRRGMAFVERIPEVLRTGRVIHDKQGLKRVYIATDDVPAKVVVIRLDWDGTEKTWIVTSYDDDRGNFLEGARGMGTSDSHASLDSLKVPESASRIDNSANSTGTPIDGAAGSGAHPTLEQEDEATFSAQFDGESMVLDPKSLVLRPNGPSSSVINSDPGMQAASGNAPSGGVMATLDSIEPLERIKLSGQLASAVSALKEAAEVMGRIKAAAAVAAIVRRLTDVEDINEISNDGEGELSDDPSSPNYRYKDTGYIADSRKERAASTIFQARKTGQRVRTTAIDFDAIEQNPREAADLITKSNLFGKTDWQALQDGGMEPAAGFLIDKIYASIGPEPTASTPQVRKDYAIGLEAIRDRLEDKFTAEAVMDTISEIRDELSGTTLNADEADAYAALMVEATKLQKRRLELEQESGEVYDRAEEARRRVVSLEYEIESRKRRKWTAVEQEAELIAAKQSADTHFSELSNWRRDSNPELDKLRTGQSENREAREVISRVSKLRNLTESQTTRSWLTFGERFFKMLNYRRSMGSDSFAGHVANAKNGRVADWSWADKTRAKQPKTATQQEVNFQLKVADQFVRKGGREIAVSGTKALEQAIGLSAVQSGNWVLKDPMSAKFHVEQTAGAMADLADVLGVEMQHLGLGGRIGLAFGARGTGGKGAARAHYEPTHRVVNITKMGGGGCLGHEVFHAFDNVLHELVNEKVTGRKGDFVTAKPELLPDGVIKQAVIELQAALLDGGQRIRQVHSYSDADIGMAKRNIVDRTTGIAAEIKKAGSAAAAVLVVDAYFEKYSSSKKMKKNWYTWRLLAVAYYHDADLIAPTESGIYCVGLPTGPKTSNFKAEAVKLDSGEIGKYWSEIEELAARAFQGYVEDKLSAMDRQNDYLSVMADNKHYFNLLSNSFDKPFPEGEERERINAAMDNLFAAIREEKVFEKAASNKPLLDSIFGAAAD